MTTVFGIPVQAFLGQLLVGLINGSFYAMLSLGLAIIFGLLRIINFAHGALYMLGAFVGYLLLANLGIGYWPALVLAPAHRRPLRHGRRAPRPVAASTASTPSTACSSPSASPSSSRAPFRYWFGVSGKPYAAPAALTGGVNLGFMFLPIYRGFIVVASLVVCLATWLLVEKTQARRLPPRRDREPHARPGLRRQRPAAPDLHLRPRLRARRASPASWRRRSTR